MKKTFLRLAIATIAIAASGPAFSEVLQIWGCTVNKGFSFDDVMKLSQEWTDAARKVEGGTDLTVYIDLPIVTDDQWGTFNFVLALPDQSTWGRFNDNYSNSAASKIDARFEEMAECDTSTLWLSNALQ